MCKNNYYLYQLVYFVYRINDVRKTEIHTRGILVPELSLLEIHRAIEKLEIYTSHRNGLNFGRDDQVGRKS